MKTASFLLAALLATSLAARAATTAPGTPAFLPDCVGLLTVYVPAHDDGYDAGAGLEGQARLWINPYIGGALAAGFASYAFDDQEIQNRRPNLAGNSLDGDLFTLPVGFSLLVRPVLTDRFSLTLEGGVRYVFVESYVELEGDHRPGRYYYDCYYYDYVNVENGIVAVALAQVQVHLVDMVSLIAGAGYQFDLEKGDIEWYGEDIGENKLESVLVQAGMAVRF